MDNAFDQLTNALETAESVKRAAQNHSNQMARLLTGNLRYLSPGHLKNLKRELADFNIQTGRWKVRK